MNLRLLSVFLLPLALLFMSSIPVADPAAPTSWQADMLSAVNELRARGCRCGGTYMPPAPPLSWNRQLASAAIRHATDQEREEFFSHTGSDGSKVGGRTREAGYHWRSVGENIAWNYQSVASVVRGWRNSPGHCRNMMNRGFHDFAAARRGDYWVQVFGAKATW